jgi:hypothetical protein
MLLKAKSGLLGLISTILVFPSLGLAQNSTTPAPVPEPQIARPAAGPTDQQLPATITGTVVDTSGAFVRGARVVLSRQGLSDQETLTSADGQFSFTKIAPGPFQLTITATGFASQTSSGTLQSGESYLVERHPLSVATAVTDVEVSLTQTEVAAEEIKAEEKQRVLGFIPNFYVSYFPHPVPLTTKQKFGLAWKTSIDPISFVLVGATAGIQQATNDFDGYGQGAQGYAKRYGASYADLVSGTFIGGAILPSLLKQDPRYFYKGIGTKKSRALYAIASSVICKGDNGRWQANYSNILGSFAAGGISNLYYPAKDREGAEFTIENGLIGIGATSAANLIQEFIIRKLTPKLPKREAP